MIIIFKILDCCSAKSALRNDGINAYCVSKWKILLKGKLFWMRSLGASFIGEITFVIISLLMEFLNVIPFKVILQLIFTSLIIKLIINPILIIPSSILTAFIKNIEKNDLEENSIEFNPFKIKFSITHNDRVLKLKGS